jgi:cell division protein FtsZ
MGLEFSAPENVILKPIITVFGVGGAGGNAVNNMIRAQLQGANFVVANTDAQALKHSECANKVQLGASSTKGLGAGASPDVGQIAAQESEDEIKSYLEGSNMVFITAGMGGGTGTGASPVIAKIAKDLGILTVGVVTKPFLFEGGRRMKAAESGLQELQKYVDTLIVIPNQNLFRIANESTTFTDAFKMADEVLHAGVRGVTDLITMPGLINLDFADIKTVMSEMGKAMMGTGEASGEERAIKAAEAAIANPLLDQSSMYGASGVLINITGGRDMTLYEVDSAANRIREEVGDTDANIIFGSTFNPDLEGVIRVSVVATGIDSDNNKFVVEEKEEIVEVEDDKNLEQENINYFGNEHNDAPPSFNQYQDIAVQTEEELKEQLSKLAAQMTPQPQEKEENRDLIVAAKQKIARKPSLFKRMWNSLKASDSEDSGHGDVAHKEAAKQSQFVTQSSHEESKIQDAPSFFRKDR